MLTAKKVQAITLQLTDHTQAVLVQDGPDWNGLRKFVCVSPLDCDGQTIIAAKGPQGNTHGTFFNLGESERWAVLMVSPDLAARLEW